MSDGAESDPAPNDDSWRRTLKEVRLAHVELVLARVGGNKSEAARILGIDRRSLYRIKPSLADGS
jgi:two-component system, NtrC family, response regulator AtoC